MTPDELRYPIGRFVAPAQWSRADVGRWTDDIAGLPHALRPLVTGLDERQLDTPYRPGGWTARQVVHHLPDSHLNAYVRFKWALTEDEPRIKAYDEVRWAELDDSKATPVEDSLDLLDALHRRWVILLRALGPDALGRRFLHPESGVQTLATTVASYAWHGRHHLAHIERVAEGQRENRFHNPGGIRPTRHSG